MKVSVTLSSEVGLTTTLPDLTNLSYPCDKSPSLPRHSFIILSTGLEVPGFLGGAGFLIKRLS